MASGIYEIVNLVNGKRYVGSAVSVHKRWAEHRRDLASGQHHSVALQRAWVRYGSVAFAFRILETCEKLHLIAREQQHINIGSHYNIYKIAGSSLGVKHSPQTRARMSAKLMGNQRTKGMKYSREICERMAAPKRGRKRGPMSEQTKLRLSAAKKGKSVNFGRVASDATKEKIRQANLGKRYPVEVRQKRCSLTDEQVRQIRSLRAAGSTYREISSETGVDARQAGKICRRERYEWIDSTEPIPAVDRRRGWKYSDQGRLNRSAQMKAIWAKRKASVA